MRSGYTARAVRGGRRWAIDVLELPGVFSQARRLDQAEAMAREAISLMLDVPGDSFDVTVVPDRASLGSLQSIVDTALEARDAAARAQERASDAMRHAVREIRASGYTSRDAGVLLGVSNQRISQIEREAAARAPEARSKRPEES